MRLHVASVLETRGHVIADQVHNFSEFYQMEQSSDDDTISLDSFLEYLPQKKQVTFAPFASILYFCVESEERERLRFRRSEARNVLKNEARKVLIVENETKERLIVKKKGFIRRLANLFIGLPGKLVFHSSYNSMRATRSY
jgi:hypothetical protein